MAATAWGTGAGSAGAAATEEARYIVVLADGTTSPLATATRHEERYGAEVGAVYAHALDGYAARLTSTEAARLRTDPAVVAVEQERPLQLAQVGPGTPQKVPTNIRRVGGDRNPRIDIDGVDDARIDADIAILDTGIVEHEDLAVASRVDCTQQSICRSGGVDAEGHGTLVAGVAGALDNGVGTVGVAPGARLHAVKVCLNGCFPSWVLAGLDHIVARGDIEVANLSLGSATFPDQVAVGQAITRAVDRGIVVVVAAGNSRVDTATFFPANHPEVIAVSNVADSDGLPGGLGVRTHCMGLTNDDRLADDFNFGATVDVAAPGRCVTSTARLGGYGNATGTSFAAPHVAGAAALLSMGSRSPDNRADVLAVRQRILAAGTYDWFDTSGDGVKEPMLQVSDPGVFPGPRKPTTLFADSFETAGWTVNFLGRDTATRGRWERGTPEATSDGGVPMQLGRCYGGTGCMVTGRLAGADARANDVDGGTTSITSPVVRLPNDPTGTFTLEAHWYHAHGTDSTAADELKIRVLTVGSTTPSTVWRSFGTLPWDGRWGVSGQSLAPWAGRDIRIVVEVTDTAADSLVEAALDDVTIRYNSL